MTARNAEHERLKDDLLLCFGSMPNVRCWVRDVGFDPVRKISFGQIGECDIDGIISPWGIRLGIEVKTGSARLSEKQKLWRNMLIRFGGIYIEARSVPQACSDFREQLDNWKEIYLV